MPPTAPTQPPSSTPTGDFFFSEADFFSAKRLFFRAARDVSGVRSNPPWAASGDTMAKTRFRLYTHSPAHGRAKPSHPRLPTFCSLPSHKAPSHKAHHPIQKKKHSLLVLLSVHTIINFATEFFEMFTKKQSRHP